LPLSAKSAGEVGSGARDLPLPALMESIPAHPPIGNRPEPSIYVYPGTRLCAVPQHYRQSGIGLAKVDFMILIFKAAPHEEFIVTNGEEIK